MKLLIRKTCNIEGYVKTHPRIIRDNYYPFHPPYFMVLSGNSISPLDNIQTTEIKQIPPINPLSHGNPSIIVNHQQKQTPIK